MKRIGLACAFGLFALASWAIDYEIPANTTVIFPAQVGAAVNKTNSQANAVILNNGSVVKVDTTAGNMALFCSFVVKEGNAVIDFDNWTKTSVPTFRGCIQVAEGATLTLRKTNTTGSRTIDLGNTEGGADTAMVSANNITVYNMSYDLGGLRLDGEGITALRLRYNPVIRSWPTDESVLAALEVRAGRPEDFDFPDEHKDMALFLYGPGTAKLPEKFAALDADGYLSYDGNVAILTQEALADVSGVTVAAGRRLWIDPRGPQTPMDNGGKDSLCLRQLPEASGAAWPAVAVKWSAGSQVLTRRGATSSLGQGGGYSVCGYLDNDNLEITQIQDGATVSLANKTGNLAARFFTTATNVTFTDATVGSLPMVVEDDTTIDLKTGVAPTICANAGTTVIKETETFTWNPAFWLDASATDSLVGPGQRPDIVKAECKNYARPLYVARDDKRYPVIEQWFDRRMTDRPYGSDKGFIQPRFYNSTSAAVQVFPYLVTDGGPNGLPYLCFDTNGPTDEHKYGAVYTSLTGTDLLVNSSTSRCRLMFCKNLSKKDGTTRPSTTSLTGVRTIVTVFGSQNRGGVGFVGCDSFRRADSNVLVTATTPIVQSAKVGNNKVWLNGAEVVPDVTTFSGEWDIVSAEAESGKTLSISAIGTITEATTDPTGQNYAEILFFTNRLSTAERQSVERYLAKKWGLTGKYAAPAVTKVTLANQSTAGTVKVEDDVTLTGKFVGTIDVAAGTTVTIDAMKKPATRAEVEALQQGNVLAWFDPSDSAHASTYVEDTVWEIFDVRYPVQTHETKVLVGAYVTDAVNYTRNRAPYIKPWARGLALERNWLDFYNYLDPSKDTDGNTARLQTYPNIEGGATKDAPLTNVRTVVMVQDSFRGGGTPFATAVNADPKRNTDSYKFPIMTSKSPDSYTNAALRLNGKAVQSADGFTGGPEIYSVVASSNMQVGCFGYFQNTQAPNNNGELQGEILLYSCALTSNELVSVESYLMDKWLNRMPEGFGDLSGATLKGAGTVVAATGAQLPKIDATFSGTARVTNGGFAFTVDAAGNVGGAIAAQGATLELPEETCTATVTLTGKPPAGEYVLVDCRGFGTTTWDVTVDNPYSRTRPTTVVQKGGQLILTVERTGAIILIR